MFVPRAIAVNAVALGKHHDQPGRNGQMRLFRPGANRLKRADPGIAAAARIKGTLFFFGRRRSVRRQPTRLSARLRD